MHGTSRRKFLTTLSVAVGFGLSGCLSDDGDGGEDGDSSEDDAQDGEGNGDSGDGNDDSGGDSTTESGETSETSGREITGEVNNELEGLEVLDHSVHVSEDSLSGSVTLRNVGSETASLVDHEIKIRVFDAEGSVLGAVGSWGGDKRELAPDEEGVMEFSPGPAFDADLSLIESYAVVLTCSVADPGVYCP